MKSTARNQAGPSKTSEAVKRGHRGNAGTMDDDHEGYATDESISPTLSDHGGPAKAACDTNSVEQEKCPDSKKKPPSSVVKARCPDCPLKRFKSDSEAKTHIRNVHGLFYGLNIRVKGSKTDYPIYLARGEASFTLRCPSCEATHQSPYTLVTHGRQKHDWVMSSAIQPLNAEEFDAACFPGASNKRGFYLASGGDTSTLKEMEEDLDMLLSPALSLSSQDIHYSDKSPPPSPTNSRQHTPIPSSKTSRERPIVVDDISPPPKRRKISPLPPSSMPSQSSPMTIPTTRQESSSRLTPSRSSPTPQPISPASATQQSNECGVMEDVEMEDADDSQGDKLADIEEGDESERNEEDVSMTVDKGDEIASDETLPTSSDSTSSVSAMLSSSPSPAPSLVLNEDQTLIDDLLIHQYQLRVNKEHRVLLCLDPKCLHAVVPSAISHHLKRTHQYTKLPKTLVSAIRTFTDEFDVHDSDVIPNPPLELTPVSGMAIHENGFRCKVEGCGLGFRRLKTAKNHWNAIHPLRKKDGHTTQEDIEESAVQGYFPDRRGYFPVQRVKSSTDSISPLTAYDVCIQEHLKAMKELLPPPMTANETPMMEKITHWLQHLTPYLRTKQQLQQVLDMKKPLPQSDKSWLSGLRELVTGHMLLVHAFAMAAGLDILVLLKCYATSEKEAFRALSDENTMATYSQTILTFLLMCIRSLNPTPGHYALPLDDEHRRLLKELQTSIETNVEKHKTLHRFLVYALGPDEGAHAASEGEKDWDAIVAKARKGKGKAMDMPSGRSNVAEEDNDDFEMTGDVPTYGLDSHVVSEVDAMGKFKSIIDCFLAVLHLGNDGKMKQPGLVTQSFAQLAYFARATALCEGHYAFESNPDSTLLKCVENAAQLLLAPLKANAFNKAQNYTRFISALVYNTARPAACRVSDDGDEVQYGRSAISVTSLRLKLQSTYELAEALVPKICRGAEEKWKFPSGIVDDWRESERGYGLVNIGDWLTTPHPLISAIIADDPAFFSVDEKGSLTFDHSKAFKFLSECRELLGLLAILLFIIPGQPPRAAEFLDHKLVNGQKDRTVFLGPNHHIWIVTRRSKTETQTQREVFVPLVLPPRLKWLFMTYALIVRPVEVQLCAILHGAGA